MQARNWGRLAAAIAGLGVLEGCVGGREFSIATTPPGEGDVIVVTSELVPSAKSTAPSSSFLTASSTRPGRALLVVGDVDLSPQVAVGASLDAPDLLPLEIAANSTAGVQAPDAGAAISGLRPTLQGQMVAPGVQTATAGAAINALTPALQTQPVASIQGASGVLGRAGGGAPSLTSITQSGALLGGSGSALVNALVLTAPASPPAAVRLP